MPAVLVRIPSVDAYATRFGIFRYAITCAIRFNDEGIREMSVRADFKSRTRDIVDGRKRDTANTRTPEPGCIVFEDQS
jgi:hypothetical protein